ncbi:alpha/beta hydrolase family protein [Flavobacterium sp. '19STA2R22 D10 B1']|uniref:alpha/beta hydrolase family protein n=1 Tax=Flavobacterium aerium TaxID=3037261 RepID=UPI00278BEEFA|nr:prolyl oligopeptidase family serine peptidase [Flavobacterium sp. '19STA2R22 D10 B1']
MSIKNYSLIMLFFVSTLAVAQKKKLTVDDFDTWKRIEKTQLSENGKYLVYECNPGNGDGSLVITNTETKESKTIQRGYDAQISGNSTFVTFKIKPQIKLRRKAETKKWKKDKLPTDSLGIFVFKTKEIKKYPNLRGFEVPSEGGEWIAYKTVLKPIKVKDTTKTEVNKKKDEKKNDTIVIAYNPILKDSLKFSDVKNFSWSKKANKLMLSTEKKKDSITQSTIVYFDADLKKTDTVFKGKGTIIKTAIEEKGEKFGFLFSKDTTKIKRYELYKGTKENVTELKSGSIKKIPNNWTPSDKGGMYFSENGKRLFFGTAFVEMEKPKDTILNIERAGLDVWAWTDKDLQPQQKINLKKDQNKTYTAVYDFELNKAIQLSDTLVPELSILNKGDKDFSIGTNGNAYKRSSSWDGLWIQDFYKVNINTGENTLLVKAQNKVWIGGAQKYAMYYNRKDSIYYSINLITNEQIALTKGLKVPFYEEKNDQPSEPYPYGVAGWDVEDKAVFVYDRYDIWKLDPKGKKEPQRITKNGREEKKVYRYIQMDDKAVSIDTKKEVLLSVFEEKTKRAGYAQCNLNKIKTPEILLGGDYMLNTPKKAKNSKEIFYTKQTFVEYPDVLVTANNFKTSTKLSDANPQQKDYKWGSVSLETWKAYDGVELEGLLYKPENFDPNKKYPMVTYFYELNSETYHAHYVPAPSRSTIGKPFYTSNDYLVFVPDIVYKVGYPGQSAYNCIVSGVDAMIAKYPYVDEKHVALQGQSWGGYQTAYLVTKTDKFAAAMAGAPVSNMTSAYGGIRWESGMSRMAQYEHTQSRIGTTLWDNLDLYLENSPLFSAPKVKTPLLLMHNDNDGAVPWYQSIEYFVALRRLNKPVWMLNYNNEPHNLKAESWGNRKDLSVRMMQFFDHYLKGKEAPEWMLKGRSAVDKEKNKG